MSREAPASGRIAENEKPQISQETQSFQEDYLSLSSASFASSVVRIWLPADPAFTRI